MYLSLLANNSFGPIIEGIAVKKLSRQNEGLSERGDEKLKWHIICPVG